MESIRELDKDEFTLETEKRWEEAFEMWCQSRQHNEEWGAGDSDDDAKKDIV